MLWTRRFAFGRAVARLSLRGLIACVRAVDGLAGCKPVVDRRGLDEKQVAPPRTLPADKTSPAAEPKPNDVARQASKIAGTDWPKLRADLIKLGRKSNAIEAGEGAVAASRRTNGDVSKQLATDLVWLGTFYVDQDDLLESVRCVFKEALTIRIKLLGEKHDLTGDARRELANVDLRSRLTPAERQELIEADHETQTAADRIAPDVNALKAAKRSLEIRRLLLGSEHPLVASSLNVLGEIEKESGQFRQAESDLKQALTIRQAAPGERSLSDAADQGGFGVPVRRLGGGDTLDPLRSSNKCSKRVCSTLGDDHDLTGDAYSGFGFSYMLMGDFAHSLPARDLRGAGNSAKDPGRRALSHLSGRHQFGSALQSH